MLTATSRSKHLLLPTIILACCYTFAVGVADISLKGNGFLRYDIRNKPFNPNVNRLSLHFRTTHPSGIIVYLLGSNGDSLELDLVQGTLRLRLKKKGTLVNEVLIGRKLDNNKWHAINILRITRLLDITLNGKAERIILIPGFTTDLNLNRLLYIGGASKQAIIMKRGAAKNERPKLSNFKGCLRNLVIDNKQPLIELRKRNKNIVVFGIVSKPCRSQTYNPIQFANDHSWIDVVRIPVSSISDQLNIKMQFRTFDSQGTIVYGGGKRCHFVLGVQKKQVYLELRQDEVLPAKIEIQGEISDGLWHNVQFTVAQTDIYLQVDNGARVSASLPKMTSGYQCNNPSQLLIGGGAQQKMKRGFVGCLDRITVNGKVLKPFDSREVSLKGSVKKGCKIKDRCFPSPCRNGGRCYQTWHSYGCDCSKTTFYGKHCSIRIYKATCAGYKAIGLKRPSFCILDSDGTGRLPPYTISCDMNKDKEIATAVHHDREKTVNVTDGTVMIQGAHFHLINYELNMEHIEALIKNSLKCRQFLKFDCYNSALLNSPVGTPNANWQTRTGQVKSYWAGVPDGGKGCKCGLTRSCLSRDKLCNCDSLNNRWVEDSGYVENKDLLPITRLHFTKIHRGFGYVTLGPLECFGTKETDNVDERPPSKILAQVCMSGVMKKYMTANETQLVWNTPVEKDGTDILEESAKSGRTKTDVMTSANGVAATNGMAKNQTQVSLSFGTDINERNKVTVVPILRDAKTTSSLNYVHVFSSGIDKDLNHPLQNNSDITLLQRHAKTNSPFGYSEDDVGGRKLSILEIILIVFAALAIFVLLLKFVIMKGVDFIRRRYQIKRLYLNESPTSNTNGVETPIKIGEQGEFRVKKGVLRKSRNSDWV